ncbi:hypothetical protein CF326_g8384 [Tilletia indica]|nr:hypothetical protein CF326_g8384 [Tilletia indica]
MPYSGGFPNRLSVALKPDSSRDKREGGSSFDAVGELDGLHQPKALVDAMPGLVVLTLRSSSHHEMTGRPCLVPLYHIERSAREAVYLNRPPNPSVPLHCISTGGAGAGLATGYVAVRVDCPYTLQGGRPRTPFAAHANANAAAYERYGQIRWEVKVDGFLGRVFGITPRDQARSACLFMVGGRPQRKDEVTGHRINHLLRLMEAVLLAHSVKNGGSFSARPWAVGFDGNRQPIWQPSGVGHGGRMTLVKIDEEPVEPLLPPTFPRSSCLDETLCSEHWVKALNEERSPSCLLRTPSSALSWPQSRSSKEDAPNGFFRSSVSTVRP